MKISRQFNDVELIKNIQSDATLNDAIAFIYSAHFNYLSAAVTYNNGSNEDAQDIVQEVIVNFIELVRNQKFRGESSVKTFLHVMTRNTWLNELKKRGRAGKREMVYEKIKAEDEMIIADTIESRQAKQQLLDVFETLGNGCKKILTLFYYDNLSMKEILAQTEYDNEQVVRNKKHKCLKELTSLVKSNTTIIETLKENFI
ncbi:MAG: sigma-70 family RNA polymerase sigma factor [Agriterribacter sp.]